MSLTLASIPILNLLVHGAGRSMIKNPKLWKKPGFRAVKDVAKGMVGLSYKAGLDGKVVREMPLAALGAISPGASNSISMAHELGMRSRKMGVKTPEGLVKKLDDAIEGLNKAIWIGKKAKVVSRKATPVAGAAIGGLAGHAVGGEDYKGVGTVGGVIAGAVGGRYVGRKISRKIGKYVNMAKANRQPLKSARGVADDFAKEVDLEQNNFIPRTFVKAFFK